MFYTLYTELTSNVKKLDSAQKPVGQTTPLTQSKNHQFTKCV